LFERDRIELGKRFTEPGRLVDLGCGTGRHSLQFASKGFNVVAVELSQFMLEQVGLKLHEGLHVDRVQANLCHLGCFPDASFDYALSMFSTLGMIRGVEPRRQALREIGRIVKPGGRLALHAHNIFLNLRDPQGRAWLWKQLGLFLKRSPSYGDQLMTYREIPAMEVHLYRWNELKRDLRNAGFVIEETVAIDEIMARPIAFPSLLHSIRAGGWIVFCRRT
jgi:ubiquinone/menaquinone biosynthesis C-methylase UbiE